MITKKITKARLKTLENVLPAERMEEIENWVKKYPPEQKQSAVLSVLTIVQEEHRYLTPELMDLVATYLDMPAIAVYEVASFYTLFQTKPVGRHIINVCTNISCKLKGADKIVQYLEEKLNVKVGETTVDGKYTLCAVECLAACVGAPMLQLDKDYHENLTTAKIDKILNIK